MHVAKVWTASSANMIVKYITWCYYYKLDLFCWGIIPEVKEPVPGLQVNYIEMLFLTKVKESKSFTLIKWREHKFYVCIGYPFLLFWSSLSWEDSRKIPLTTTETDPTMFWTRKGLFYNDKRIMMWLWNYTSLTL